MLVIPAFVGNTCVCSALHMQPVTSFWCRKIPQISFFPLSLQHICKSMSLSVSQPEHWLVPPQLLTILQICGQNILHMLISDAWDVKPPCSSKKLIMWQINQNIPAFVLHNALDKLTAKCSTEQKPKTKQKSHTPSNPAFQLARKLQTI